jgi:hypothetical protein
MFRNQFRLLGYLAPIALVALPSLWPVLAQKPAVVSSVSAPLTVSLTSDANTSAPAQMVARRLCT